MSQDPQGETNGIAVCRDAESLLNDSNGSTVFIPKENRSSLHVVMYHGYLPSRNNALVVLRVPLVYPLPRSLGTRMRRRMGSRGELVVVCLECRRAPLVIQVTSDPLID